MVLAALCIGSPIGGAEQPAPKPVRSILICYFSNPNDYQSRSVGAAIGRMLRYRASNLPQLSNLPPLNVIERVMRQEGLTHRLALNLPEALKVAKVSGQEWTIIGTVKRTGKNFIIRAEIYGASTGRMIGRPIVVSGDEAGLPKMEPELARNIFSGIGLQLTAQQQSDMGRVLTTKYQAVRLLGDYLLAPDKTSSRQLDKLLIADTKFPVAAVHRVDRAMEEGRYTDAILIAREWKVKCPSNRDFPSYEFGGLLALRKFGEAANVLNRLDAGYPDSFSLTLLRHWLYRFQGNYGGALETARKLTELNSASPEGRARTSIAALERALHIGASLYLSQMTSGQAREFAASVDLACEEGERAVALDPRYDQVWLTLMAAYRERGDYVKSYAAYRKLMALDAGNCEARSSQALNYLCQNKTQMARELWEDVLIRNPRMLDAQLGLAICAKYEGASKTAAALSSKVITADKRYGDMMYLRRERSWPIELAETAAGLRSPKK